MLRNILIGIGLLVMILPYLGFPSWIDTILFTLSGLTMIFLLTVSKKGKIYREWGEGVVDTITRHGKEPKVLHVERTEVEDSPRMHIERSVIEDTAVTNYPDETTTLDRKITIVHARRKKNSTDAIRKDNA